MQFSHFYVSDNYSLATLNVVHGRIVFLAPCNDLRRINSRRNEARTYMTVETRCLSNWRLCDWYAMRRIAAIACLLGRIYNSVLQPVWVPSVDLPPVCLIGCIWIVLIRELSLLPLSITMASVLNWFTQRVVRMNGILSIHYEGLILMQHACKSATGTEC